MRWRRSCCWGLSGRRLSRSSIGAGYQPSALVATGQDAFSATSEALPDDFTCAAPAGAVALTW
jgi:hypothetical protein